MTIWFTSDTHFGHKNIIKFEEGRKHFSSIDEHDAYLINMWNKQVKHNDTVYHLGDLTLRGIQKKREVLEQLNGNIILVKGNHDADRECKKLLLEGLIKEYHQVGVYMKVEELLLHLTHYPMITGLRPKYFNIHGHLHSNNVELGNNSLNLINIGVDNVKHFPERKLGELVSLDELIAVCKPIDEQMYDLRFGESSKIDDIYKIGDNGDIGDKEKGV